MKKQLITFFVFLTLLIPFNKVFSYGLEINSGNKFYSSIVDNLGTLESQIYTIDVKGTEGINEKIKNLSGLDCIKKELTEEDLENIVNNNITVLKSNFSCDEEDGVINQGKFDKVKSAIKYLYNKTKNSSKTKAKQIFDISNAGIYADGIEANGPFDLINDLEQIDEIIFEKKGEAEKFVGGENIDLGEKIKDLLEKSETAGSNNNVEDENETYVCDLEGGCENISNDFGADIVDNGEIGDIDNTNGTNNISDLTCQILGTCKTTDLDKNKTCAKNETDLNKNYANLTIKNIEQQIKENSLVSNTTSSKSTSSTKNGITKSGDASEDGKNSYNEIPEINSDYTKRNDNKVFPCNNFFCITIDFVTNEYNLFGGWVADAPSIEFLLERSNKHLKKFAATSQSQSKMSINNWENILKDLDLSEMFHMSIQISKKPVPILDLNKDIENGEDKDGQTEEGELALESQLKKYYELYGLNYKMRNDLSLYRKIEQNRLSTLNSNFLGVKVASEKFEEYMKILKKQEEQIENLKKAISEKSRSDIMKNFELQFKEIEIFNNSAKDYVNNLDTVITNMLKIPVDSGTT